MRPPGEPRDATEQAQDAPDQTREPSAQPTNAGLPAPVPNSRLTLPAERLAGSDRCLNCGTVLQGPFCHYCGQPDKNLMRFFPVLLRELLEDFMDFDSRFMRTLKPLLFKPGKLTRDYLDGRRFRYVPPLRLYIFSSLAFFFLAALITTDALRVKADFSREDGGLSIQLDEREQQDFDAAMEDLAQTRPELATELKRKVEAAQAAGNGTEAPPAEAGDTPAFPDNPEFNFNGEPWDRETNPLEIPMMPGWFNEWINDEIADSPRKGREIADNPNLFTEKMFDVLPATMFVLLPLVALLFKFWYLFSKRYYVEHLIFALHNHAFIFTLALVMLLTGALAAWREPAADGPLTTVSGWLQVAAWVWIPLYLLISLKRVYRQGWVLTLFKYSVIGTSYVLLLSFATLVVAGLSFVLL